MSQVLVLVEHHDGAIAKVTGELLTAAARLGTPGRRRHRQARHRRVAGR